MRGWDSVSPKGRLRPGPAAIVVLLAGLLLSLAPVSRPLELTFVDWLQRALNRTASSEILLIDTRNLSAASGTIWQAEKLPHLLERLSEANARLVLLAEPPMMTALPEAAQLATLAEVERRSWQEGAQSQPTAFARQLAELRRRADLRDRIVNAMARMRNVIVAVSAVGTDTVGTSACSKYVLAGPVAAGGLAQIHPIGPIAFPPADLCAAILGAGHVNYRPDADGVVRSSDLLVTAAGALMPSAALAAVLAMRGPAAAPPAVEGNAIHWGSERIRANDGMAILTRYYAPQDSGRVFDSITADDLLRDQQLAGLVQGRIVVLGDSARVANPGVMTPYGKAASLSELVATDLSNLIQKDYLLRPAWLPVVEKLLLVVIGIVVLTWGRRPIRPTATVAGILAASLAAAEALLFGMGFCTQFLTAAAFLLFATGALQLLQWQPFLVANPKPTHAMPAPQGAPALAALAGENELDLAFSMLRHQAPSEHVKRRLYEIALEHARQRDLAKAERVLRHLAGVDPDYRHAAEKLKKLGGMRVPPRAPQEQASKPDLRRITLPPAAPPENLSGRTIGRYQIEKFIGRGAMATVYLGRDPRINRHVAIKTIALAEEFSDADVENARTQFLREAESAGRLNHPNIISIYDAGEDGDIAYLAMEYFPGKPLSQFTQQGVLLPAARVLEIAARAAEALNYAHNQHVVHRDIKPANLLYDVDTDTLKITDFGIARLTDSGRTKTGIVLGTPSYMSPEQLAGGNVTGQSDLFSLGITLFQLLAGAPPFRADSIPRLMQKIAQEPHPSLRAIREDLQPEIDSIIDRALAKDPADRFSGGRAMALALRECCSRLQFSGVVRSS